MTTLELFEKLIDDAPLDFQGTGTSKEANLAMKDFYAEVEIVRQRIMEDYTLICFLREDLE